MIEQETLGTVTTNAENIDRMSDLPEHIVHSIMSFLPIKDAARISGVSTKFRSAWSCFPIIEFNRDCANSFLRKQDGVEGYLNFMHNFLQRRTPNTRLLKFVLHGYLPAGEVNSSEHRIDAAIRYAFDNHVKDLELHIRSSWNAYINNVPYDLPLLLYPVNSVTVLSLEGFNLEKLDLTKFLGVEELRLQECYGLKVLKVSLAKLKTMEVAACDGLLQIDIEKSNLRSFTFTLRGNSNRLGSSNKELKLNMADAESLKDLILNGGSIPYSRLNYLASEFLQLENLILRDCKTLTSVCIPSPSLKTIEIHNCNRLDSIEVVTPRLESFVYSGGRSRSRSRILCLITISACKLLRNLELHHAAAVTDDWVHKNVREFHVLENLLLSSCSSLQNLRFSHEILKSFQLLECDHLMEAIVYAPSLVSFKYMGEAIASLSIDSPLLEAELILQTNSLNHINEWWYYLLREFLAYFDHCKLLTIDITYTYEKFLLFPEDVRNSLLPPLFDLRHLKVKMFNLEQDVVEWVQSLLWLSPLLKTISLSTPSVDKSIKFEYAKRKTDAMIDEDQPCCRSRIVKCWRHSLSKVSLESFENGEKKKLMEFFDREAMRSDYYTEKKLNNSSVNSFGGYNGNSSPRETTSFPIVFCSYEKF